MTKPQALSVEQAQRLASRGLYVLDRILDESLDMSKPLNPNAALGAARTAIEVAAKVLEADMTPGEVERLAGMSMEELEQEMKRLNKEQA